MPMRRRATLTGLALALCASAALGQQPVITGTSGADSLTGTPFADVIDGLAGDDYIDGGDGPDVVTGGTGQDTVVAGEGDELRLRDGEPDRVLCTRGVSARIIADPLDRIGSGCPAAEIAEPLPDPPARTDRPLHIVYDFAGNARLLHDGYAGVPGLGAEVGSHRQHPLGEPFPRSRWIGKVNHRELPGRSARQIASLLQSRMNSSTIGGLDPTGSLVAVDEVGVELEDGALGPRFAAAMRILSRRRHPVTREPLSRRVVLYIAPKFVANVGARNDRENWDSAMAATRLSGAVFLQMFHASEGRVTGPATREEWRDYPAVWRAELGREAKRLRFLFSGVGAQDVQWRNAAATPAGRATLRAGAGAYRLGSTANVRAWLRNWNTHTMRRRP